MEFRRVDAQTAALTGLNTLLCELLRLIPASADPEASPEAQARLYPMPGAADGDDELSSADWPEYVHPELRKLFGSALDTVREDLAGIVPAETPVEEPDAFTLPIPFAHLEAWLNALNQARLTLAARYDITSEDMENIALHGGARAFAIFQINIYGVLQEWIIAELQ